MTIIVVDEQNVCFVQGLKVFFYVWLVRMGVMATSHRLYVLGVYNIPVHIVHPDM